MLDTAVIKKLVVHQFYRRTVFSEFAVYRNILRHGFSSIPCRQGYFYRINISILKAEFDIEFSFFIRQLAPGPCHYIGSNKKTLPGDGSIITYRDIQRFFYKGHGGFTLPVIKMADIIGGEI